MCKNNNHVWLPYAAAITASITCAGYGSIMSWTSPALSYLESQESEIPTTKEQSSWIAPLLPIGLLIGNFINPLFINRIGRKWTLMLFALPQTLSWLIIFCTKNINLIYLARIMGGIGYGGGVCALTVYLSEIGTSKNRGIFLSMVKFSLSFGVFFTLLLGAIFSYNYMNFSHLMMPVLFILLFFFLPDSSYFLDRNKTDTFLEDGNSKVENSGEMCERNEIKQDSKCEGDSLLGNNSSLNNLQFGLEEETFSEKDWRQDSRQRSRQKQVSRQEEDSSGKKCIPDEESLLEENASFKTQVLAKDEKEDLEESIEKSNLETKVSMFGKLKESGFWKLFSTSNNIRALTIIVCVVAQDAFSGHMILTYFTQQMLSYNGSLLSAKQGAVFLSGMKLTSSVLATQVMERVKRRTLFFCTGILASLFQGIIGVFFYLENQKVDVSSFSFVPFLGLVAYEFSVCMGTSNLFYVLQGELFESDVKGLAVTFSKTVYMVLGFVSIIMYQILIEAFNAYVLFFVFFISGITFCFITVSLMPETKGRNIEEITMLLKKKTLF